MNEIDRADVEGCRHADLAAKFDHPIREVEARAPVIEAPVDMAPLDIEESARVDRFGEAHKKPHGEGRAAAVRAGQKFAIERGEVESHPGDAIGGRAGRSMLARRAHATRASGIQRSARSAAWRRAAHTASFG